MIRGTRIITGEEAGLQSYTINRMRNFMLNLGFQEVIVPSIWEQKTFTDKAGDEILEQMYTFQDKKERDICLIPEVTAIIQEQWREEWSKSWKKPAKIFYVNRCYRYERPQAGRYREFLQFGVEMLGLKDVKDSGFGDGKEFMLYIAENLISSSFLEYNINDAVKRGLSYYTEDGFEIECPILGAQKQVCGGGAYAEGIGFAIGVDRLLLARKLTHEKNYTPKTDAIQAEAVPMEADRVQT